MNNTRRKEIDRLMERVQSLLNDLSEIKDGISTVQDEEQDYLDNMPESMRDGEKAQKAQEAIDVEDAKKMEKKLKENSFTLEDYLTQFETMKKMGGIKDILSMMPNMGGGKFRIKEEDVDERKMLSMKAVIQSMTPKERQNPAIINSSRKQRIAKGSGTSVQEVNRVLKQFEQTKQLMKQMKNNKAFRF